MKLALRFIIAGAGLALFAWFVYRTGVDTIPRAFATLGWSAPLILLPYALVYLLDTGGWRLCLRRTLPKSISFGTLFRIRWAGESLNNVVPSAYLGGEAVKVYLLHKRGLPVVDGASSVIIGKTAQVLAEVIFIAIGAVAGSSFCQPIHLLAPVCSQLQARQPHSSGSSSGFSIVEFSAHSWH